MVRAPAPPMHAVCTDRHTATSALVAESDSPANPTLDRTTAARQRLDESGGCEQPDGVSPVVAMHGHAAEYTSVSMGTMTQITWRAQHERRAESEYQYDGTHGQDARCGTAARRT